MAAMTMIRTAALLLTAALLAACMQTPAAPVAPAAASLFPSRWTAIEIAGAPLVAGSRVTLAFKDDGSVSGLAGCNRYVGQATLTGDRLTFAPLATTKMACADPAMVVQEAHYLTALGTVERAALAEGSRLDLFGADPTKPTRFAPDAEAELRISGIVTYRQRSALPPEARLEVRVEDVSLADAPATLIAETAVAPAGQVPIAFELAVDPSRRQAGHSYAIRASIYAGKTLLFTTDTRILILTGVAPGPLELVVVPARR